MAVTVQAVNKRLEALGMAERLARAKDHFFFHSGTASTWTKTVVWVKRVSDHSVDGWLAEHNKLRQSAGSNRK